MQLHRDTLRLLGRHGVRRPLRVDAGQVMEALVCERPALVEPTTDVDEIRAVVTHPAVWPWVVDDAAPEPSAFVPPIRPGLIWLRARFRRSFASSEGNETGAVWMFEQHNAVCWEIHTCILPAWRGALAVEATKTALAWMFANGGARKIMTHVPADNRLAYRFALRCGLTDEGVNRASFLKGGVLLDQHILGLTEGEICLW